MGRGNGRRRKNRYKPASSQPNRPTKSKANGNDTVADKREDTPDPTENMTEPQQAESASVSEVMGENAVKIFSSPNPCSSCDPSDPNKLNFAALSLSDDKENYPKTPGKLGDSLFDDRFHGLEAIDRACRILYPFHKRKPVIASPAIKVWMGGPMPLDYVKIFLHEGDPTENIVPHWHYISYGLSDLHGDGRVHVPTGRGYPSGFGCEITFRMKQEPHEINPPLWPVKILQELAGYCFNVGKRFNEFDHIPWSQPLNADDITDKKDLTRIKHLFIVEDPKFLDLDSPNGTVKFLQVVGVVEEEMLYARAWTTFGVVDYLLDHPQVGPLLITDMQRTTSIFELKPELRLNMPAKVARDGSNLTNITAHMYWIDTKKRMVGTRDNVADEFIDYVFTTDPEILAKFIDIEHVTIHIDPVAAEILPIMVKGRLMKKVTFILDNPCCVIDKLRQSIFFIPHGFEGNGNVLVSQERPMKGEGGFLQIFCNPALLEEMALKFVLIEKAREKNWNVPLVIWFMNLPLVITVHPSYQHVIEQHGKDKELGLRLNAASKSNDQVELPSTPPNQMIG